MYLSIIALAGAWQATSPSIAPPPIITVPVSSPPPAPPPPPNLNQPARARANLASYVSSDDYPAEALHNDEQGTVGFRLHVAENGRADGCVVTSSSHSASLDDTTCRVMMTRARFVPAIGLNGRPARDVVHARLTWRLEEDAKTPIDEGESPSPPVSPIVVMQRARPIKPLMSYLSHNDFPPEAGGGPSPGTSRFSLTVAADGSVAGCEIRQTSGSTLLDAAACRLMRDRARFAPGRDASGNPVADSHWGHIDWRGLEHPPVPVPRPVF